MFDKPSKSFRDGRKQTVDFCAKTFDNLIQKKEVPLNGWDERLIEQFLVHLANIDTNNRLDMDTVGAGEREGRVVSPLVARLHFHMSHGIGRSGNLTESQPKARGSSMMAEIANSFALQVIKQWGVPHVKATLVVPLCTGMSLALCLQTWRRSKPTAKYVIFSRIDQKSCFKAVITAGYEPIIVDTVKTTTIDGNGRGADVYETNVDAIENIIMERPEEILAVLTTTSCFAPRGCDLLERVAEICKQHDVFHLVNNAYGLTSSVCAEALISGNKAGRIDAFVQSLDKNFMVPVGGSIIAAFKRAKVDEIAAFYPGRASAVPCRDFMITVLHLGAQGLRELLTERERCFDHMSRKLREFALKIGENVLTVTNNRISLAMTLKTIPAEKQTLFGGILFTRGITGARVVRSSKKATRIEGYEFTNWGSHTSEQHTGYLNIACGIGMTEDEIDELFVRLDEQYGRFLTKEVHGRIPMDSLENPPTPAVPDATASTASSPQPPPSTTDDATSTRRYGAMSRSTQLANVSDISKCVFASNLMPAVGHCMVPYGDSVIIWGGYYRKHTGESIYLRPSQINILPFGHEELWVSYDCRDGSVPYPTTSATAMIWRRNLLIFGGSARLPQEATRAVNDIFLLNLDTGIWSHPRDNIGRKLPSPRDKATGWEFRDKCYFFGGYGDSPDLILDSARRIDHFFVYPLDFVYCSTDARFAWNRQLLVFDSKWHLAAQAGDVPPARAAASSTLVPHEATVYLFGGRLQNDRLNDLYALNLNDLMWRKIDIEGPCGRSWCTLTYVPMDIPDKSYCFLYGGIDTVANPLSDCWRLSWNSNTDEKPSWSEVTSYDPPSPRLWHSACFVGGQIIVFGGMSTNPFDHSDRITPEYLSDLWRFDVSPKTLTALCCLDISPMGLALLSSWKIKPITDKAIWCYVLREIKEHLRTRDDRADRAKFEQLPEPLRMMAEYVFRQRGRSRKIRRLLELCSSPQ